MELPLGDSHVFWPLNLRAILTRLREVTFLKESPFLRIAQNAHAHWEPPASALLASCPPLAARPTSSDWSSGAAAVLLRSAGCLSGPQELSVQHRAVDQVGRSIAAPGPEAGLSSNPLSSVAPAPVFLATSLLVRAPHLPAPKACHPPPIPPHTHTPELSRVPLLPQNPGGAVHMSVFTPIPPTTWAGGHSTRPGALLCSACTPVSSPLPGLLPLQTSWVL